MVAGDPYQGGAGVGGASVRARPPAARPRGRAGRAIRAAGSGTPERFLRLRPADYSVLSSLTDSAACSPRADDREPLGLPYARVARALRRRRPAHQRLRDPHRPRPDRVDPGARLPRPRPGLQPALGRDRASTCASGPHPLRHGRPGARHGRAARCRPGTGTGSRRCRPSVLDRWPVAEGPGDGSFTSVGNWRGYGSVEHGGVHYGQRAHSMRRLMELPSSN